MFPTATYQQKHLPPLIMAWEFIPRLNPALSSWEKEWKIIEEMHQLNSWKLDIDLSNIVKKQLKTIVITNSRQEICFVNRNFEKMTGYSKLEVLGKRPNFLQGEETSNETKLEIKNALTELKPISTNILNYKKTGEKYFCKVDLMPIFNSDEQLVNFLAIEEEIN